MRTPDEIGKAHGFINGHSIQSISTNIIRDFREAILDAQKEAWNEAIKLAAEDETLQYFHKESILKLLK